jgi:hypothetical protein
MWEVALTIIGAGLVVGFFLSCLVWMCLILLDMSMQEVLEAFNEIFKN